jgi:hypothetical protein
MVFHHLSGPFSFYLLRAYYAGNRPHLSGDKWGRFSIAGCYGVVLCGPVVASGSAR